MITDARHIFSSEFLRKYIVVGIIQFKGRSRKYIVFKDKILKYQIGNQTEKDYVCAECRKMGISDGEMNWSE